MHGAEPALRKSAAQMPRWLAATALIATFALIELWFNTADFWRHDFFQTGGRVVVENLARIAFTVILFWLIYAPGQAVIAAILPAARRQGLSLTERILLGFTTGVGLWHVVMLVLGIAGLYERPVMIGLAGAILLLSAPHFGALGVEAGTALGAMVTRARRDRGPVETWGVLAIAVALAWVLVVRGLYPGGGGDYYTHYFPYYLAVLKNHGLAPNDVWYHYFYSKGAGLVFLGMLLTDPEAPALTTFCCVAAAALAIAALGRRMAPGTLWPACGTVVYLAYCLISFDRNGGGEFPKDHELVSALLALTVWAMCMQSITQHRAFLAAAVSCAVAATIATQPIGILLCLCIGVLAGVQALRRQWRPCLDSLLLGTATGVTVLAMFALGYATVGLASDQALNLMLRFSNVQRLDQLGWLPQIVLTAWIRNNYAIVAPPLGWYSLRQLATFARWEVLWPILVAGAVVAAIGLAASRRRDGVWPKPLPTDHAVPVVLRLMACFVPLLLVISVFAGRVQNVSYDRFSTFFVPLLVLLALAAAGWGLARLSTRHLLAGVVLPAALVASLPLAWQHDHWSSRLVHVTANGIRFLDGQFSLADAYEHQEGPPYGGIDPEALAAARQLAPGTPIWSLSPASYCMAPRCHIESVASYKMSGALDRIVEGSPQQAENLLRLAGIDYFLLTDRQPFLSLLPYSRLFAPDTIGTYLGIRWTDGSAYLLTWKGPGVAPLDQRFLAFYGRLLARPEDPWFQFSALAPQFEADVALLRTHRFGAAIAWPWAHERRQGLTIVAATYGGNCGFYAPASEAPTHVWTGNMTWYVDRMCRSKTTCRFAVDVQAMGDPAQGCAKDFSVSFRCRPGGPVRTLAVPAEANGKTVALDCPAPR